MSCIYSEDEFNKMMNKRKPLTYEEAYEKLYGHPIHYIQCMCSTAHTFGNVTAYIQNWLLHMFPENTFKTIHVNSKIAHLQMRSTPKEFLRKDPPMFIIRPRIDWNDTNKFLNNTPIMERRGNLYNTYGETNLQEFFHDDRRKIAIKYQMNRHVINFDVVLIFQTLISQINWANYIQNAIRQEIPFNLETCLESYISIDLLKVLSKLVDVPFYDENGSIDGFLKYMNGNSIYPITYKLQGSSGTEEFYRYYPVNIDTILTNFSVDEGTQVGHITDRYQITFTLRCEFNGTGFYYLFSDKVKDHSIVWVDDEHDSTIIPIFTDVLTRDDINLPMGWKLYASPSCRLENKNDEVKIDSVLNDSIRAAIKFHKDKGIPISEFFRIRVRKQGQLLQYGKDYTFDVENCSIHFYNGSTYHTYKIIIMLNIEYINNLVKDVYKLK